MEDFEDEEGSMSLSGVDFERIKNMSAEQWKAERRKGIRTRIMGSTANRGEIEPTEVKRRRVEPTFSKPPTASATRVDDQKVDGGELKPIFYQEGSTLAGMTATQQEMHQKRAREDKVKLSKLNERLQRFRQVQKEDKPANQSSVLNELEELVLQGKTLDRSRAESIIQELRDKLPPGGLAEITKRRALAKAASMKRASKAGRLMIALTGTNSVDGRQRGGQRTQPEVEPAVTDMF